MERLLDLVRLFRMAELLRVDSERFFMAHSAPEPVEGLEFIPIPELEEGSPELLMAEWEAWIHKAVYGAMGLQVPAEYIGRERQLTR